MKSVRLEIIGPRLNPPRGKKLCCWNFLFHKVKPLMPMLPFCLLVKNPNKSILVSRKFISATNYQQIFQMKCVYCNDTANGGNKKFEIEKIYQNHNKNCIGKTTEFFVRCRGILIYEYNLITLISCSRPARLRHKYVKFVGRGFTDVLVPSLRKSSRTEFWNAIQ